MYLIRPTHTVFFLIPQNLLHWCFRLLRINKQDIYPIASHQIDPFLVEPEKISSFKSSSRLDNIRLLLLALRWGLYKHRCVLLGLFSSIFLLLQKREVTRWEGSSIKNLHARQAGIFIAEIEKYTQLSTNYYTKVTQSPIYCSFLCLAFIASSALVIYAHGNTLGLMEISKQGHTRVKQLLCTF